MKTWKKIDTYDTKLVSIGNSFVWTQSNKLQFDKHHFTGSILYPSRSASSCKFIGSTESLQTWQLVSSFNVSDSNTDAESPDLDEHTVNESLSLRSIKDSVLWSHRLILLANPLSPKFFTTIVVSDFLRCGSTGVDLCAFVSKNLNSNSLRLVLWDTSFWCWYISFCRRLLGRDKRLAICIYKTTIVRLKYQKLLHLSFIEIWKLRRKLLWRSSFLEIL